jgi:TorA-specific chaperone
MALAHSAVSPESGWNAMIAEWLAGLFMAPLTADAVASYCDGLGADLFDALTEEPGCGAGAQRMRSALLTGDPPAAVARKLAAAFTLLFDGVGGSGTVSPYESAHVSVSGRLFQAPAGDMDRLLRQWDVSADDAFREPPDHLSIELALLARLMRRGASPQAEAALLDDHLLAWAPIFADRCCAADRTGFYAGAGGVLTGFLAARRAALQVNRATNSGTGVTPCRPE